MSRPFYTCSGTGVSISASRRPSVAASEVDNVLRSILPYGSGVPAGQVADVDDVMENILPVNDSDVGIEEQFETSHHVSSAAEKHAFLHSQHGLEDVF